MKRKTIIVQDEIICIVFMYIVEYMHVCSHINTNVPLSETIQSLSLELYLKRDVYDHPSFCFLFTPHSKFCHPSQVLFLTSLLSHYSLSPVETLHLILFRAFSSHFGPSVSYLGRKQRRSVWAVLQKCCLFTSLDIFITHVH